MLQCVYRVCTGTNAAFLDENKALKLSFNLFSPLFKKTLFLYFKFYIWQMYVFVLQHLTK